MPTDSALATSAICLNPSPMVASAQSTARPTPR